MGYLKSLKTGFSSKLLFYLPLILGLVFIATLILHYSVNAPAEDQWEMVPLFQKVDHHTLGASDLWQQHNEHRIFFPLLVLLGNAYLTHWNTRAELLIGLLLAAVTATLLFLMVDNRIKRSSFGLALGALIAVWFFSPIQSENWMWGWQLEWFMCVAGCVATIFLILKFLKAGTSRSRNLLFAAAAACSFVVTFSLANGVFAWILGLFILVIGRERRKPILAWIIVALLSVGLYYHHYVSVPTPAGSPGTVLLHHPFLFIEFVVAFLGGIVGSKGATLQAPDIVGSLLLLCLIPLLYLVWTRRKNILPYMPWLALILLALLSSLSTAFGRLGYGVSFALNSRYTAFSLLFVIGLIGLAFTLLISAKSLSLNAKRLCASSLILISLPLLVSSYASGIHRFRDQSAYLHAIKSCTDQPQPTDICLARTYPSPQVVRPRLEYLKSKHWAGY